MVAAAGWWAYQQQRWSSWDLDAQPSLAIEAMPTGNGAGVTT